MQQEPGSGTAIDKRRRSKAQPPRNYEEMLPQAVAATLSGISLGDQFFEAAWRAARQAGCELLFEIPSLLFRDPAGRAAAIRCGNLEEAELFFFIFNPQSQSIRVVAGSEAPQGLIEFTRSYAGVLDLIARNRGDALIQ
jgi:hypothetical protein